jgi:hypothetical protein
MIASSEFVGGSALAQGLLDAIPFPVFVLNQDVRIVGFNDLAKQIIDKVLHSSPPQFGLPQERIQALRQTLPCGEGETRNFCLSRNLVAEAFEGKNSWRCRSLAKVVTFLGVREFEMVLSASRVEIDGVPHVLLVVEEPAVTTKGEGVVSICARCKKMRDEKNRWVSPDRYLSDRWGVRMTHGLCPECLDASLAEIGTEHDEFG